MWYTVGGTVVSVATMENSTEIPQKVKTKITKWSSHDTSGHLSKECESTNLKRYRHFYVHHGIIYDSQDMETTYEPISGWMDKEDVVYIDAQWNIDES